MNTKFFHLSTLIRRRRNMIDCLMNNNGEWVSNKEELIGMAVNYYSKLFSDDAFSGDRGYIRGCFPLLDEDQRREVEKGCVTDEVWRVLRRMGPSKAPGPDGFPASFFQRTWAVTGPTSVSLVKQVLEKREMPPEINESLLILIPKEGKSSSIKGFRPISLCNVCIKLVTKIIVNRLKGL